MSVCDGNEQDGRCVALQCGGWLGWDIRVPQTDNAVQPSGGYMGWSQGGRGWGQPRDVAKVTSECTSHTHQSHSMPLSSQRS